MELVDNIYVINLEKDVQRKDSMKSRLSQFGIDPIFINGVYGKKLTENEKYAECTRFCAKFCTNGAIGCALSHKKAWTRVIENGDQDAIIMEDDVVLHPDHRAILSRVLTKLPTDWDFVYLGCTGACDIDRRYDLIDRTISLFGNKFQIISPNLFVPEAPLAFHCYLISNDGARKLLNLIPKVWQNIDASMITISDKLNIYATNPQLAIQENSSSTTSNNISQNYPVYINKFLDKFRDRVNITYGYKLSFPYYNIYGYDITAFTFAFLLLGLLVGMILRYTRIAIKRKLMIILGIILIINLPEFKHFNWINMGVNGLTFIAAAISIQYF